MLALFCAAILSSCAMAPMTQADIDKARADANQSYATHRKELEDMRPQAETKVGGVEHLENGLRSLEELHKTQMQNLDRAEASIRH